MTITVDRALWTLDNTQKPLTKEERKAIATLIESLDEQIRKMRSCENCAEDASTCRKCFGYDKGETTYQYWVWGG
jgi:recombinational DNA repair protein RecR